MAHASYHPETRQDVGEHWLSAFVAVIGLVAAAIGLWYAYGPANGTIDVLGWTASIGAAGDWVAPTLLMGGGLVTVGSMGFESIRDFRVERTWAVGLEALVALAGLAAIVVGIIVLF
jgi:hypothetical protein